MGLDTSVKQAVAVVQSLSCFWLFVTPSLRLYSNSCPLSQRYHPTISCYPLLLLPPIFPSIRVFSMSQLYSSGGQSIAASASISVLPMNCQGWFPLGLTGLIFLQSKVLSGGFCNTTVQKHQFFGPQPSLRSNSHSYMTTGKKKNTFLFSKARICRKWKSSAKSSFPTMYFLDRRSEGAHLYGCRNLCVLHFYNFLL